MAHAVYKDEHSDNQDLASVNGNYELAVLELNAPG
jgi:hypothetical protein